VASTVVVRSSPDQGRLMLAVADRYRARFKKSVIAGAHALRRAITTTLVEQALGSPAGLEALLALVDETPIVKDATADAIAAYREVASTAAKATLGTLKGGVWVPGTGARGGTSRIAPELLARLDVHSPYMQTVAETLTANLVVQVNAQTKAAIRDVIATSHRDGTGPFQAAADIREIVGLTSGQAAAVANFRQGLRDARDNVPGRRPLSSWSLAKVPDRLSFSPAQIDTLTAQYADRLLDYRAYNIARTETLYAANVGQQATFKEMARMGFLDPTTFRRVWSVVDDDRLCEDCAPMDGQVVAIDEDFTSSEKGVLPSERTTKEEPTTLEVPPLHPSCRCIIVTEQVEAEPGRTVDLEPAGSAASGSPAAETPSDTPPGPAAPETPPEAPLPAAGSGAPSNPDVFTGAASYYGDWAASIPAETGWDAPVAVSNLEIIPRSSISGNYVIDTGHVFRVDGRAYLVETNPAWLDPVAAAANYAREAEAVFRTFPAELADLQTGFVGLQGANPDDAYWAVQYNRPGFTSNATGGNGTTTMYGGSTPTLGSLRHEAGHTLDYSLGQSAWRGVSADAEWSMAMATDSISNRAIEEAGARSFDNNLGHSSRGGGSHVLLGDARGLTGYGMSAPVEDFAEAVRLFLYSHDHDGLGFVAGERAYFADLFPGRAALLARYFPSLA